MRGVTVAGGQLAYNPPMESPVARRPFRALPAAALLLAMLACAMPVVAGEQDRADEAGVAERLIRAFDLLGTPYHRRGASPDTGFDCSGFIGWVFREAHQLVLPRSAREMFALGSARAAEVARDALEPGDLVFFRIGRLGKVIDHVGMYVGDGRFIHAPASGGQVRIDPLDQAYWTRHFAGARRILGTAPLALAATPQQTISSGPDNALSAVDTIREETP